ALCFLTSAFGDSTIYTWLLNSSGMSGFLAWLALAISHFRFRKGYLAHGGRLEDLPYRPKLFPFGPRFAFALCRVITPGQNS
ncbi:amino acid permease, partial [Pseudomonas aeruginosa]